jgi:hypothetical protein
MRPLQRFLGKLREVCIVGAVYRLEPSRRSKRSHDHQFAWLGEAFKNLPEELKDKHESAEHLRKWALCMTGYCYKLSFVCQSRREANKLVFFALAHNEYAIIDITSLDEADPEGPCILVSRIAESQSRAAMGGTRFQQSKTDVLNKLADLIGTTPDALERSAPA